MVKMRVLKIRKRGALFTLGFTFLALVILSLSLLIFHSAQKSEETITNLVVLDRVYELDTSLQQSLKDIFNLKSGILINISNNSVSFQEGLPNTNSNSFSSSMNSFKGFIESNFSNINLTIDNVITELPLNLAPFNITYKHLNFGDKEIQVIPEQINFNGYSVTMVINTNVTSCNWNIESSGSFTFSVSVKNQEGLGCSNSFSIDPSGIDELTTNNGAINIKVKNNVLSISIEDGSGINANVKTTILADTSSLKIEYPQKTIKINFNELGVYKESKARIS